MKAAKSETAEELISLKAGMNTAAQVVLDEVVQVEFFHAANQFTG